HGPRPPRARARRGVGLVHGLRNEPGDDVAAAAALEDDVDRFVAAVRTDHSEPHPEPPPEAEAALLRDRTREDERAADDLVIDATMLSNPVHEHFEVVRNLRRQIDPRALVHLHRIPHGLRRKLLLFALVALAALLTAGVASATNGGFTPEQPHSPNAHH